MKVFGLIFLVIYLMVSSVAGASDILDASQREKAELINQNNGPVLNDSPSNITGSNWQLQSGSDKSKISIKVTPKDGLFNSSLTFAAPIEKDSDASSFNKSNELVNDASVKLAFSYVQIPKNTLDKIDAVSVANLPDLCEEDRSQFEGLDKKLECSEFKLGELVKAYKGNSQKGLDAIANYNSWVNDTYYVFGATIEVGKDDFEYFKPDTLEKDEHSETAWSVGALGSVNIPQIALLTIKADYQNLYKAAKNVTRCPVASTSSTVNCASSSGAAPEHVERIVTTLESRFLTNRIYLIKGVSPKASYNDDDYKWTFDLPVFFLSDSKGVYNGGINSSWNNENHKWQFSVFVGAAFPEL